MSMSIRKRKDPPENQPTNLLKFFAPTANQVEPCKRQKPPASTNEGKSAPKGRTRQDAIIIQDSDDDEPSSRLTKSMPLRDGCDTRGQPSVSSGAEIIELEVSDVEEQEVVVDEGVSGRQAPGGSSGPVTGVGVGLEGSSTTQFPLNSATTSEPLDHVPPLRSDSARSCSAPETPIESRDEEYSSWDVEEREQDEYEDIVGGSASCEDNNLWYGEPDRDLHESQSPSESCPVCARTFETGGETNFQEHVNECLDSQGTLSGSSLPSATTRTSSSSSFNPPRQECRTSRPSCTSTPSFHSRTASKNSPRVAPTGGSSDPFPLLSPITTNANAFSLLMSSDAQSERAAWNEAQVAEDRSFRPTKDNGGRRKAPFYKVLQGMPIAVDAFRYGAIPGVNAYFLTHAHSDHYTNLASNWRHGPIYCSETTAKLIVLMLSVDQKWIRPLPMDIPVEIPDTGGVTVTLIDANHCPGSCLFLFEGRQKVNAGDSAFKSRYVGSPRTFRYLHCGDFRANPKHVLHPAVKGKKLDDVYLDTTYADPKYCFPPQPLVVKACAELVRRVVNGEPLDVVDPDGSDSNAMRAKKATMTSWLQILPAKDKGKASASAKEDSDVLIVVGTYSIGKERVVKAIANVLSSRVYCDSRKAAILECQSDSELHAMLTRDPHAARIHVVPLGMVNTEGMKTYLERWNGAWKRIVAFRPTGWTYKAPPGTSTTPAIPALIARSQAQAFNHTLLVPTRASSSSVTIYGVPYSEHSSFLELTCFALSLDWVRMIATVNVGSARGREKINGWVEKWKTERDKRGREGQGRVVSFRSGDYW